MGNKNKKKSINNLIKHNINDIQNNLLGLNIQMSSNAILVNSLEYESLQRENLELKTKIFECDKHKLDLINIITQKDKTIEELKKENEILKKMLEEMSKKLDYLINKNKIFEALSKLNDCDKLANDSFKREYKKYFNLKKYDNNVPNLGQFIDNPPDSASDKDDYDFWVFFCKKYPNSDNKEFRLIYKKLSSERIQQGAHYDIHNIDENEFDELLKIALPDIYNNNKKLCEDYKKWIYLF